jgi:proteic killer suppression protein
MIKIFKHKGLEKLFYRNIISGVNSQHVNKLKLILAMLNAADDVTDMNAPALKFHQLTGNRKGTYSVNVNGNWRVTFQFIDGNAYILDYEDYH